MKLISLPTAILSIGLLAMMQGCSSGPSAREVAAAQAAAARQEALETERGRRASVLEKAAGGSPNAQFEAGVFIYEAGTRSNPSVISARDFEDARSWFERAAAQGHVAAMHNLGVLAWNAGDFANAVKWLEQSDGKHFRRSRFILGVMYWNAQGVRQDVQRAVAYLTEGADSEDEMSIAKILKQAAERVQAVPDANPALPGQGGFVILNDGKAIRVRFNPISFNISER